MAARNGARRGGEVAVKDAVVKPGQRVIVALRKMIASGELPAAQRIAEIATAEALGVSRMPVRMALRRLEQEGLVEKCGARGYMVRGVSPAQIVGAIQVRGVLEGLAARQASERGIDRATMQAIESCLLDGDRMFAKGHLIEADLGEYHQLNIRFHAAVVNASGNPALLQALARNNALPFAAASAMALDRMDLGAEFRHLSSAHAQHHAIYHAIRHHQPERAEILMRDHAGAAIRNGKIFENLSDAAFLPHLPDAGSVVEVD